MTGWPWLRYNQGTAISLALMGLFALATVVLLREGIDSLMLGPSFRLAALLMPLTAGAALVGLSLQPRRGWYQVAAGGFIGTFLALATYSILRWSIDLPEGLLMYAVVVVMAGVLLGAAPTLSLAAVIIGMISLLALGQDRQITNPDTSWMQEESVAIDAVPYGVTLGFVALGSWLANRESNRLLRRALGSENALRQERDGLEARVEQRTQQLEEAYAQRVAQLQRFAELGRVSASLLHDIANPLTAASIQLQELESQRHSRLVRQAGYSLRQLERQVEVARCQLYQESQRCPFVPADEIQEVVRRLAHKAHQAGVRIECGRLTKGLLYGDPVKFNQLVANLVAGLIDAHAVTARSHPPLQISLRLEAKSAGMQLILQSGGAGIAPRHQRTMLQAFYTTKPAAYGIGLGLAMVKRIAEEEFGGAVHTANLSNRGVRLVLRLRDAPSRDSAAQADTIGT